jgi:prepilin-type processing-associated H-X9-DG protein
VRGGIWIAVILFVAAICLNQTEKLVNGIVSAIVSSLFLAGSFYSEMKAGLISVLPNETAERIKCSDNLRRLGDDLLHAKAARGCFITVYTCDIDGKPIFSWTFQCLSGSNDRALLKTREPWNSPHNAEVLKKIPADGFRCPSAKHDGKGFTTNYIAIIGPGTTWRDTGIARFSDMPEGGSHTVMLVEAAMSDKHWVEPFALTVEEVLENMKNGQGVRISSYHTNGVHVLFADGTVRCLPLKMPLSLWRKILDGELPTKDLDSIYSLIDPNATDMIDLYVGPSITKTQAMILGIIVWLVSIVLLSTGR